MGLFDSLRAKLKGVSKKLEDEVEKSLGDQLEAELAAAMKKDEPKAAPLAPVAPAPAPPPAAVQPPSAPIAPKTTESALSGESVFPSAAPPSQPTVQTPSAPIAPKPIESVPSVESVLRPAPAPAPQLAPPPARPSPPVKTAPQPGRKLLSDDEISSRLERELSEAVAVQKVVEKVAHEAAPASRFTINETVLDEILWDLEIGLLESDVALPVVEAIKRNVREQLLTMPVGGRPHELVEQVLRSAIQQVLQVNPMDFDAFVRAKMAAGKKPVVIMFVGVNGTGKTTSIGRIAHRLKTQGISCVLAAGDTFRAGAIEQLALHGERLGVNVIKHKAGADPAAVAYDAIEHAKARHKDVVLLDTAGRMQNNRSLMDEMDKMRRVANPDLCVFVGDSLAGNDAVEQARKFDEVVDVGGVILTKVDVDAKGGAALSVAYTINKPLIFVGVGQGYDDLRPFDAKWLVDRLFGDDETSSAAA